MKAIIFDKDGVITDSEFCNIGAGVRALRDQGIEITEEEKQWIVGRHPADYIKLFAEKYQFRQEIFSQVQGKYYKEIYSSVPLIPEAIDLINRIYQSKSPQNNTRLALTTSSIRDIVLKDLHRAHIGYMFDAIITFEDCTKRKPDPESYLLTAQKLDVEPKDCIVIEDSSIGLQAAKNAGMKCIVIPNQYTKHQDFSKADLIVDSASKITIDLLNRM